MEQTVPIIERRRIRTMSHKCVENQFHNGIRTCNLAAEEVEVAFQARQILLPHDFNPSVVNIAQYPQHPLFSLPAMGRGGELFSTDPFHSTVSGDSIYSNGTQASDARLLRSFSIVNTPILPPSAPYGPSPITPRSRFVWWN